MTSIPPRKKASAGSSETPAVVDSMVPGGTCDNGTVALGGVMFVTAAFATPFAEVATDSAAWVTLGPIQSFATLEYPAPTSGMARRDVS